MFINLGFGVFHAFVKTSAQATNYKFKSFVKLSQNFLSSAVLVWKVKCYVHLVRAFLETLSGLHQLR